MSGPGANGPALVAPSSLWGGLGWGDPPPAQCSGQPLRHGVASRYEISTTPGLIFA
jgi:hypothetical protein